MSWKTIKTYSFSHEAAIDKGLLESEGIQVFLKNDIMATTYNLSSGNVGGIYLQVTEKDVFKALSLLNLTDEIDISEAIQYVCHNCGSEEWKKEAPSFFKTLLNLLSSKKNVPIIKCANCNTTLTNEDN